MAKYGAQESTGLIDAGAYHAEVTRRIKRSVYWNTPGLRVTRFRMVTDRGFPMLDKSYCHGMLDGEPVNVELPFFQLSKRGWKGEIIEYAQKDGVYAKGLGILDNASILWG